MFKGRQFDQSVILLGVRWYLAYNLSLRDLEEMMAGGALRSTTRPSTAGPFVSRRCCWSASTGASAGSPEAETAEGRLDGQS
jgi:hypothetical protein